MKNFTNINSICPACPICNEIKSLTKHHIIPKQYTDYIPLSRYCDSVIYICRDCHDEYEKIANKVKDNLFKQFGLPSPNYLSSMLNYVKTKEEKDNIKKQLLNTSASLIGEVLKTNNLDLFVSLWKNHFFIFCLEKRYMLTESKYNDMMFV